MAEILSGTPVAASIIERTRSGADKMRELGTVPLLAIVRVGGSPAEISYEKSAVRACSKAGIEVRKVTFPSDTDNGSFLSSFHKVCNDGSVHGVLLLRPLPEHLDEGAALSMIPAEKDVDGCCSASFAGLYSGDRKAFAPCTAQAVTEILDFYKVACEGKKAVILGRSLVSGLPAAMLLMRRNATVTVCHSKTADPASEARSADILVSCTGNGLSIGCEYFNRSQTVIDVGISESPSGGICGDVIFDEALASAAAVTPVPGGVGSVTSAVLASHTLSSAKMLTTERG